jgi:putative transposase
MKVKQQKADTLPTIWTVSDDLWARIAPVIGELDPPSPIGRKRIDARAALNAMIYVLRTGCQWNQLPEQFPDDSSVHRTMQRWIEAGVFEQIWVDLVTACADLGGVDWTWQAVDGAMQKARLGGITSALTRRIAGKRGRNAA